MWPFRENPVGPDPVWHRINHYTLFPITTTINRIAIITTINRIATITTINIIAIITTIHRIERPFRKINVCPDPVWKPVRQGGLAILLIVVIAILLIVIIAILLIVMIAILTLNYLKLTYQLVLLFKGGRAARRTAAGSLPAETGDFLHRDLPGA